LRSFVRPRFAVGTALLLVALVGALALNASRAEAHGVQVSSSPAPNAQLGDSPGSITVNFSEPIEPSVSTIQLWDQSAKKIALPSPEFPGGDGKTMTVEVPDTLKPGIYTVIWRNLSTVDGHTWAGSFPFTVLGPGGQVPQGVEVVAVGDERAIERPELARERRRAAVEIDREGVTVSLTKERRRQRLVADIPLAQRTSRKKR